ncbi:MAG: methionine synthase [Firmicutes bacterium]|nr:methionine synthase [Bacillota bacterium]
MENVEIDRKEVLRYLGHRNQAVGERLERLVCECMEELKGIAAPKYICRTFGITDRDRSVSLENGLFELPGQAILKHLSASGSCVLMAATLGSEVDKKIRYYEKADLTKALVLDACATALIEAVCDRICEDIEKEDLAEGEHLTSRFSPGYGDLPIGIQKRFLEVLDAGRRIGLTASSTNILLPRKSVTAVMGIAAENCGRKSGCAACGKTRECAYKKMED